MTINASITLALTEIRNVWYEIGMFVNSKISGNMFEQLKTITEKSNVNVMNIKLNAQRKLKW